MITNHRWINPCVRHALLEVSKGGRSKLLMKSGRGGMQRGVASTSPNSTPEPTNMTDTMRKTQSQQEAASNNANVDAGATAGTQQSTPSTNKISWLRGYLGAHSNTDPPDAKFLGVAAIVLGAGCYAWFVEPPVEKEDS